MKQYTSPDQTAKLIELGFDKPKSIIDVWAHETDIDMEYEYEYAYSIGELIENIEGHQSNLSMVKTEHKWFINYHTKNIELIDALYDMAIKLKEEGVI